MLFNSLEYLIFYPIITLIYFLIPARFRWSLLLAGSLYFYMAWKPAYIILIIITSAVAYFSGIIMGKEKNPQKRKPVFLASLMINLGILMVFKYFNLFNDTLSIIFTNFNLPYNVPGFKLLLPMGISFYTFQTLSYSIDVYRGRIQPCRHYGIFTLYVTFFPQLVAGPIERAERLLPQFYTEKKFDYDRVTDGLKLMAVGFFKKVVVADRLGVAVNAIYNNPGGKNGFQFIVATIFFAFQIYCDFSGYSDIAIGSAKIMGFNLMENFKQPYYSKSISQFWKRWHISLSSWFKDYLYIPMGGNRKGTFRSYFNLFVTFLVSGLWHGANWTFVLWGAIHGIYSIIGRLFEPVKKKMAEMTGMVKLPVLFNLIRIGFTFALVTFAWIFFRANNIQDAFYIVKNLFRDIGKVTDPGFVMTSLTSMALTKVQLIIAVGGIIFLELIHIGDVKGGFFAWLSKRHLIFRWAFYFFLVNSTFWLAFSESIQFIYFQF